MKDLFLLIAGTFLLATPLFFITNSIRISLFFNSHHTSFFNVFFYMLTWLGYYRVFIVIGFVMYFVKNGRCLPFGFTFLIFLILVQFFKRVVFQNCLRPTFLLPKLFPGLEIDQIPNMVFSKHYSFPSGHAGFIFALVILFTYAFEIKNIWLQLGMILIALLVCTSRLYLMQHFFRDVYFGALLGILPTIVAIYICERFQLNDVEPFKTLLHLFKR